MKFNISDADRNLSELLGISSLIVTDICEQKFMKDASSMPLTKNQHYILKMLANAAPFNLSDIAEILSVSNAAIGKNIDKLVKYKLVTRKFSKQDRRSAKVSITQDGRDIVEKHYKLKIENHIEIFKHFSLEDKEKFTNYLKLFIRNTLHKNMNTDILCLQCDGFCGDDCIIKEVNGTCIREH